MVIQSEYGNKNFLYTLKMDVQEIFFFIVILLMALVIITEPDYIVKGLFIVMAFAIYFDIPILMVSTGVLYFAYIIFLKD